MLNSLVLRRVHQRLQQMPECRHADHQLQQGSQLLLNATERCAQKEG